MTPVCCPECRLRFSSAAATYLAACPECGEAPQTLARLEEVVGFRLFRLEDAPHSLPEAIAAFLPIPDPARGRP
jgi:hypothetical protein